MNDYNEFLPIAQTSTEPIVTNNEESLVADVRAGLSPAEMVERKLVTIMRTSALPMSRMQTVGPRRTLS